MNCPACTDVRMGVKFTRPIGQKSRFRLYQCPECKSYAETIELGYMAFIAHTPELVTEVVAAIDRAKAERMAAARGWRKRQEGSLAPGRKGALMIAAFMASS